MPLCEPLPTINVALNVESSIRVFVEDKANCVLEVLCSDSISFIFNLESKCLVILPLVCTFSGHFPTGATGGHCFLTNRDVSPIQTPKLRHPKAKAKELKFYLYGKLSHKNIRGIELSDLACLWMREIPLNVQTDN